MFQVHDRVFVGNDSHCLPGTELLAVVHACKSPCHQRAVGYSGSIPNNHPYYLGTRRPFDLYLNMIDPPVPLFKVGLFTMFLSFFRDQQRTRTPVLVHCNRGESRAPSLALVLLSKHLGVIPASSFAAAHASFSRIYPAYAPGAGISQFLEENWDQIR